MVQASVHQNRDARGFLQLAGGASEDGDAGSAEGFCIGGGPKGELNLSSIRRSGEGIK